MGIVWFLVQLIFVGLLTLFIWNKYVNWRKHHFLVSLSTYVGWYFSFLIILILPLDISITFYYKCILDENRLNNSTEIGHRNISLGCEEPKGYLPDSFLLSWWRIVYWISQLLTWIVLPIMQSYSNAGDFTFTGKLKSALYNNAIYYGVYAGLFVFLLFYAITQGVSMSFDHLKVLLISASNTWGLFLLVLLLGYGLVEFPRHLWQMGTKGFRLNKIYFDIEKLSTDKNDAEESIYELYNECKEVLNLLKNTRGPAREKVQLIMSRFPSDEFINTSRSVPTYATSSTLRRNADASAVSQEGYLIRLNKRVIEAVQNHHRTQAQWRAYIKKAFYLEDVAAAELSGKLPNWPRNNIVARSVPDPLRFAWHTSLKAPLFQTAGIFCAVMTLLIMWSECTFFIVHPQLSLAARILHSLALGYHYKYIQVCAVVMISYLGLCAYYTVFHMRIYRFYNLDPHRMTDSYSIIFSAMLLSRLTPPLCLNFLGMIHLDSHITSNFGVETQFTKLMGHLDVIPLIARGINIYLPILIVLLCLATWFRLGTHFLHSIGVDQFIDDDEMTTELIQSGRAIVSLERSKIGREESREQRKQTWASKLNNMVKNQTNGTRDADRLPILEHQEQPLLDDTRQHTDIDIDDLELRNSAFLIDTNSSSWLDVERQNNRTTRDSTHLPPSNIFDDL